MAATDDAAFQPEKIEPFEEQTPFVYDKEKRYYGFVSGSGAGKTAAGVARTELNASEWNPGAMGAIIAPTGRMIKNNIIPLMRKFGYLQEWEYKSSHSDEPGIHVSGPNGGRILLLSASDERTIEYLNGLNLAYIWMDEHRDIPSRATEIAVQRLRAGNYRNMYITTTPRGKNHTHAFFVGDHDPDEYSWGEATIYETDDRLCVGGVPSYANPHTPDDYKDSLGEDLPDEIRAQEVQGQFVEIGSGILTKDMLHYVEPDNVPLERCSFTVGVDIGVVEDSGRAQDTDSDYWAATAIAVDPLHNEGYVLDINRKRGMSLREGLEWLSRICSNIPNPEVCIESNQSQVFFSQEAREMGLNVTQVHHTDKKEHRLIQLSIPFENKTVRLVERGDNRFDELVNEWIAFPDGTHDDAIDSLEIAVQNANLMGAGNMIGGDLYGQGDE